MKNLLTLRLDDKDKQALALSSLLSEMPISKLIVPYIEEGTKVSLGSILLYHIDRSQTFDRRALESFTSLLMEPTRTGHSGIQERGLEDMKRRTPRVVWDFFELLSENRILERLNGAFDEVTIGMDANYVDPAFLRAFCYSLGEDYISSGGNLEKLDFQLCSSIFFNNMIMEFYRHNASGTARALSSELYAHTNLMKEMATEIGRSYSERTATRKFQAIVVEPTARRGRPQVKKKRRSKKTVVAREITED